MEKSVKMKVADILKKYRVYYFYPVANMFTRAGVPDIIACYCGRFIAIECKSGNNKLSALQSLNIEEINKCGGCALVVNENNIDAVSKVLECIKQETSKCTLTEGT